MRQDQAWREYKFRQEASESMGKDTEMEIYFNGIVKEMLKDLGFVPVFLEKGSMVKDIGEMTPKTIILKTHNGYQQTKDFKTSLKLKKSNHANLLKMYRVS